MLRALLDIIFPPRCHHCREFIPDAGTLHICSRCLEGCRPLSSPLCTSCGIPFISDRGDDHTCGACIISPPPFHAALAAALFDGPVRELIHRLKYDKQVHHCRPLALLTARRLAPFAAAASADLLMPVPLHVKRLRQRGFNQAVLIGETVSKLWHLPLLRHNLRRSRWTEPQINLSAADRITNVRGAFDLREPALIKDRRIILFDDVYTTGSTVAECTRVLLRAGAKSVHVATVARALH